MNALQVFTYSDHPVRVIEVNGDPYFVGKDVAAILGYRDTSDAQKKHVDEDDKEVGELPTPGGLQKVITMNESGLYSLILRSHWNLTFYFSQFSGCQMSGEGSP